VGKGVEEEVLFLVRPSFIITIVIKRYKGRTIVFASVSVTRSLGRSVCLSVPIEGLIQTWSTYISN
jgi:hypothetical protein